MREKEGERERGREGDGKGEEERKEKEKTRVERKNRGEHILLYRCIYRMNTQAHTIGTYVYYGLQMLVPGCASREAINCFNQTTRPSHGPASGKKNKNKTTKQQNKNKKQNKAKLNKLNINKLKKRTKAVFSPLLFFIRSFTLLIFFTSFLFFFYFFFLPLTGIRVAPGLQVSSLLRNSQQVASFQIAAVEKLIHQPRPVPVLKQPLTMERTRAREKKIKIFFLKKGIKGRTKEERRKKKK